MASPDRSELAPLDVLQLLTFATHENPLHAIARPLAASLLALTLTLTPAITHAQDVPPVDHAAAPAPVSLCVPRLDEGNCPADFLIKGNRARHQANRPADPICHVPGSRYYAATDPEECFATAEDAEASGYRAPLR